MIKLYFTIWTSTLLSVILFSAGCSVNEGLVLTTSYANTATNWQLIKQPTLINKLDVADQDAARKYTSDIDKVLTFIHKFTESDKNAKTKLAVELPLQIALAKQSFTRINILVSQNKDKFSETDISIMNNMKNDLEDLYIRWEDITGNNEKVSQLLEVINTVALLRDLQKLQ